MSFVDPNQRHKSNPRAHIYLFIVALIYGANYSIAKIVLDPGLLDPNTFIFMRIGSAALLFIIFFGIPSLNVLGSWRELIFASLTGVVANQFLFFNGLARTTPVHAALIMITTPILVLGIQFYTQRFQVSNRQWFGTVIAFAGTALLIGISDRNLGSRSSSIAGDLMVFFNACSYAIYLTRFPALISRHRPMDVLSWIFIFGFIMSIPLGAAQFNQISWQSFDANSVAALLFVLICTTFLTYLLNAKSLELSGPALVSQYIYLQPLLALVIAMILGKDQLLWQYLVFGSMTIFGVYLVSSVVNHR